ncbi:DUF5682 family protein [Streptomyces orinoci]|uniref:DUF5682 family protein n=1 Tax=Streptomyces orinoci TaxID=67339 RepID=A0ABV3JUN8_STRON|nr:DUF5682 family protein [Streptomyces orinoci]
MTVALLGVRHHGPGSARAVRAALDQCAPRAVLIEGPPEADAIAHLAAEEEMRPPVALFAHAVDDPGHAVWWPFADFSPEWVALRWALAHGVPVRFIDLPAAVTLGRNEALQRAAAADPLGRLAEAAGYDDPERWWEDVIEHPPAAASPADALAPFQAVAEAMAVLRADEAGAEPGGGTGHGRGASHGMAAVSEMAWHGPDRRVSGTMTTGRGPEGPASGGGGADEPVRPAPGGIGAGRDAGRPASATSASGKCNLPASGGPASGAAGHDTIREAHMRLKLRQAQREFGDRIAVVCGAWHVPALSVRRTVAADRQLLKGPAKVKTAISWVPWTHRRLSRHSGYGAGITSPGWYRHLFHAPDRPLERWMTTVARLLRDEGHPVSSAHVIEAVRLAGTLAALRERPRPGLAETLDAVCAVMCEGSEVPLALVRDRLVIGDTLGEVPESAPAAPLRRDLTRLQRSLRLKPEADRREAEFDLRKDTDAARSRLLHRLRLLGVDWGTPVPSRGGLGTFRESWRLCWHPELSVRVAEAGVWGTTVETAATAKAATAAGRAVSLAEITTLAEQCLLAQLPDALPTVMRALADRAALDSEVAHLAQALPALVRSVRYGDVRRTDTGALAEVAAGIAERVFIGLPAACAGLDRDAAQEMRGHLDAVHRATALLDRPGMRRRWTDVLSALAEREGLPGEIRGRACRLLFDEGELDEERAARLMGLALSPGRAPAEAAAWIEGFAGGGGSGGMLLVHDKRLLTLIDTWLTGVTAEAFTDVLPLLRRTFSAHEPGVRRTLGRLVRSGRAAAADPNDRNPDAGLDPDRAAAVLPVMRLLLGLDTPQRAGQPAIQGTEAS